MYFEPAYLGLMHVLEFFVMLYTDLFPNNMNPEAAFSVAPPWLS